MRILAALSVALLLAACGTEDDASASREADPVFTDYDPAAMEAAIAAAQRSLDGFVDAYHDGAGSYFAVKSGFETTDGGREHLWLEVTDIVSGRFQGRVDNVPHDVAGLAAGDEVEIARSDISDWLIQHDGRAYGGYTIRVLEATMDDSQRQQIDWAPVDALPSR